jgi:hypothetical protein
MDTELVVEARHGDDAAFARITELTYLRLLGIAYRILRDQAGEGIGDLIAVNRDGGRGGSHPQRRRLHGRRPLRLSGDGVELRIAQVR